MSCTNPYTERMISHLSVWLGGDRDDIFDDMFDEMRRWADEDKRKVYPPDVMPFGKYLEEKIEEVAEKDDRYLRWVLKQPWVEEPVKEEILKYVE